MAGVMKIRSQDGGTSIPVGFPDRLILRAGAGEEASFGSRRSVDGPWAGVGNYRLADPSGQVPAYTMRMALS